MIERILRQPQGEDGGGAGPRRESSVTFRRDAAAADTSAMLDPANQSLADALRITYRGVQLVMVLLGLAFILSGFTAVKEGERGIRLLFGEITASDLPPGFQWSAPYPLGELITVNKEGTNDLRIDKAFWVFNPTPNAADPSIDKIAPTAQLKPNEGGSGSLITADGALVHMQWQAQYRRDGVRNYTVNVNDKTVEAELVRAAVQRGIVQAVAQITIDDLLKQSNDEQNSVARIAKQIAQDTLDRAETGIVIDKLSPTDRTPPLWVRADFAKVQSAVSNAAKAIESANSERTSTLNEVAGDAALLLIQQIDAYELATATNDTAAQDRILATIDDLLQGRRVELDGRTVEGVVSGRVAEILADASQYRQTTVSSAKGRLDRYLAKKAQFEANPLLMVSSEWNSALRTFLNRDSVQIQLVPPGTNSLVLQLNQDPDILRQLEEAKKRRENEAAQERRMRELMREQFKTDTSAQEVTAR